MADLPPVPSQESLVYRLLELTAICGEFPSDLLPRLPESASYLETVIHGLKKDKLLHVHYRDKPRDNRLTTPVNAGLLERNPDQFCFS